MPRRDTRTPLRRLPYKQQPEPVATAKNGQPLRRMTGTGHLSPTVRSELRAERARRRIEADYNS